MVFLSRLYMSMFNKSCNVSAVEKILILRLVKTDLPPLFVHLFVADTSENSHPFGAEHVNNILDITHL